MEQINYIKHLNNVFLKIEKDSRLNPSHISLYVALFRVWNSNRFAEVFYIYRDEVMLFSKIGSKTTYHRCIRDLSNWNYIMYLPSKNPYKGSQIKLTNFGTSTGQGVCQHNTNIGTSSGQALVSKININKHIVNKYKGAQPQNENEVIDFFKKEKSTKKEAQMFFNHYEGIDWKISGKSKITNWQATARKWILKASELKPSKAQHHNQENLKVSKDKNYNQPL